MDYSLFVALAIVVSGQDDLCYNTNKVRLLNPAFEEIAIKFELMSKSECDCFFADVRRYADCEPNSTWYLQFLFKDLKNAPPLSNAGLYPPKPVIEERIDFNRKHHEFLISLKSYYYLDRRKKLFIENAIKENEKLFKIYDDVDTVLSYGLPVLPRRAALIRLRDMGYGGGYLPPHVPVQFFSNAD